MFIVCSPKMKVKALKIISVDRYLLLVLNEMKKEQAVNLPKVQSPTAEAAEKECVSEEKQRES